MKTKKDFWRLIGLSYLLIFSGIFLLYIAEDTQFEIYLLVGGEATRLQPLSSGIPKALLTIRGEKIIDKIIKQFSNFFPSIELTILSEPNCLIFLILILIIFFKFRFLIFLFYYFLCLPTYYFVRRDVNFLVK